ncbi:hypothetical protein ['Cynodon dactylon' phytoplasma]|uniref:hypothetical protein n=1 Tax='Cynodon dactylon' phytoplasma TaxID=295320 RepID=UPI001265D6D9|nr:hypothetical protein ['Cynodon dactylon' phytoplasma]KAB8121686.1 hypothetical protein F1741_02190 ['Cynodon dactylon' phytoplasma]
MINHKFIKPYLTVFIHSYVTKDKGKKIAENISRSKYIFEALKSRKFYYVDYSNLDEDIFANYRQEQIVFFNNYIPKTYKNFLNFAYFFSNYKIKNNNAKFVFFISDLNWEEYIKEISKLNFSIEYNSNIDVNNNFITKTFEGFFKIYFKRNSEFTSNRPAENHHTIFAWDYPNMCWKDTQILTSDFLHLGREDGINFNLAFNSTFESIFNFLMKHEERT